MKQLKPRRLIAAVCAFAMMTVSALADTALVVTPKGPLNLRRSPTVNSDRLASIPNHTTIEILDVDGDWAKAVYDEKTGFVKTDFLRITSDLAGKTVYGNDYAQLMILREPDANSDAVRPVEPLEGATVQSVDGDWAAVALEDDQTGYLPLAQINYQVDTAPKKTSWIVEYGVLTRDCTLRTENGEPQTLAAGTDVIATVREKTECLVFTADACGYVPSDAIRLRAFEDSREAAGKASPETAIDRAATALRKNYKGVANQKLTPIVEVYTGLSGKALPYYHVGFVKDDDTYLYAALVNADNAKVFFTARYSEFSQIEPLPLQESVPASEPVLEETPVSVTEPETVAPEAEPDAPAPVSEVNTEPAAETEPDTEPAAQTEPDTEPQNSSEVPEVTVITMTSDDEPAPAAETQTVEITPEPVPEDAPATESAPEQPAADADEKPAEESAPVEAAGDIELAFTGDIELGDVEDIEVTAWTDYQCQYIISKDGKPLVSSGATDHFSAAYRPREAGKYTLEVTVVDENGGLAVLETDFNVAASEDADSILFDIYSQKDNWWLSKTFYTSSLDQDGAAIFTLTHALSRIGYDIVDILPDNLAANAEIIKCLTEKGVDNAKLIKTAANLFGFKTYSDPYKKVSTIREQLQKGAVFSFTNEKGNVVLAAGISDDGALVKIIDAMPSASFDAIPADTVFLQQEDGSFTAITSFDEDPNIRWYFESSNYGGTEYWRKLEEIAPLGLLLIQSAN